MTHTELKKKIAEGFPFTLHVADGRTFHVPHEDFVWLPPRSTVVMVAEPNPENEEETVTNTIPLLMVSGVSQVTPSESV